MKQRFVKDREKKIECLINEAGNGDNSWGFFVDKIQDTKGIPYLILDEYTTFITNSENKLIALGIAGDKNNINKNTIKKLSLQECHKKYKNFEKTVQYFNKLVKQITY
jgi:hypothetical protein